MTEEKIQQLLAGIFSEKYEWSVDKGSYKHTSFIIQEDRRNVIEAIIRKFLLDNRDEEKGILEAKVFMYEEIISKSNFAPMVSKVNKVKQ